MPNRCRPVGTVGRGAEQPEVMPEIGHDRPHQGHDGPPAGGGKRAWHPPGWMVGISFEILIGDPAPQHVASKRVLALDGSERPAGLNTRPDGTS